MVTFKIEPKIPVLLKGGANGKILPVVPAQKISKYNKNKRRFDEQKKNDVKTTAAILRISEQGKNSAGADRIYKATKGNRTNKTT